MRIVVGVVLAAVLQGAALAESPLEREARTRYQKAQKLFEAARYQDALAEYQGSWELTHYAAILYRIALCQDLLGHLEQAISGYEKYLDADPASERREAVLTRVSELRTSFHPAPAPPPVPEKPAEARPPVPPAAMPQASASASAASAPAAPRPLTKKWWFWTALVAGAGAAATAIAVPIATHYFADDPTIGSLGAHKVN
jgi:tetratricopeptide (TPR) repeat protein